MGRTAGVDAAFALDELQMPRASEVPIIGAYCVNDETAIRSPDAPTGREGLSSGARQTIPTPDAEMRVVRFV
jgi:hypothetical protein